MSESNGEEYKPSYGSQFVSNCFKPFFHTYVFVLIGGGTLFFLKQDTLSILCVVFSNLSCIHYT
jgi:hypothetical protein